MLSTMYQKSVNTQNKNKALLSLGVLENTFYSLSLIKDRVDYADQLVKSGVQGKYFKLMNLYLSQDDADLKSNLKKFIDSVDDWKVGYSEAIYLAVKNKIDITGAITKMDSSLFGEKLNLIANSHDDFAQYVLEYGVPEQFLSNIKLFTWIVTMHEVAVYRCFELNDKKKYELYLRFTTLLGEYISNIYNQELLEDESDVEVLPPLHRFGYYMLKANTHLNNGNHVEYIREMKKALLNCESMNEIVEFMLEQFKKLMGMTNG